MKKHGISENILDSRRVINKDYILQLIENMNNNIEKKDVFVDNLSHSENKPNVQFNINLNENKNYIPHTYFENSANLDNLIRFLEDMNTKHKKDLKIEDFISKVYYY